MRKLLLQTTAYNHLEQGFKEWLDILGFSEMTVYNMPNIVREFLFYMEQNEVYSIREVTSKHIKEYHKHIRTRSNHRRSGGLSNNSVNKHIQALEKFSQYLKHRGYENRPTVNVKLLPLFTKDITILTVAEVKELFEVQLGKETTAKQRAINARDKCILAIYYSCGLRRNEGVHLTVNDIDFDRRLVHVKKGKNYKQRLVPFSKNTSQILQDYVFEHRPELIKHKTESAFFISYRGVACNGFTLYQRLKLMQLAVDNPILQSKIIGLHALRHSIATHLLQNGMTLQKIQQFLGHKSLESTQIYTHLIDKEDEPIN